MKLSGFCIGWALLAALLNPPKQRVGAVLEVCQWDAEGPSSPSADQISCTEVLLLPECDLHTDFSAIQVTLLLRTNIQVRYLPNGRVGTSAQEAL